MNLILNIGLNTNTSGKLVVDHLFRDLDQLGFHFGPSKAKFYQSATELTLVLPCQFHGENLRHVICTLCTRAWQDAIAYYDTDGEVGYLAGPKAEDWGNEFLREFFLMPDGRTLSAHENSTIHES